MLSVLITTLFICIFYSLANSGIPASAILKVYPTINNFAKGNVFIQLRG
jgi:hypothetical protein